MEEGCVARHANWKWKWEGGVGGGVELNSGTIKGKNISLLPVLSASHVDVVWGSQSDKANV